MKGAMPLRWGDSQDGGVVKGEVPQNRGYWTRQQRHYLKIALALCTVTFGFAIKMIFRHAGIAWEAIPRDSFVERF